MTQNRGHDLRATLGHQGDPTADPNVAAPLPRGGSS